MACKILAAIALSVCCSASVVAAEHRVEKLNEKPPVGDLPAEIAKQIAPSGFKIVRGKSRTICEVWLCRQWPASSKFEPGPEVLYPFRPGQLIGLIRYPRRGGDFRDQDIDKGVYTLRYAQQPVDGNHVGTSPTRDFLVLIEVKKEESAKAIETDKLNELSAEAAQTSHPAMLSLQRVTEKGDGKISIRHQEEHDWWVVSTTGIAIDGEKKAPLTLNLVLVGHATE